MNVGAALDFLLEKKKQAPNAVKALGIEWLYRLITDFEHSKKKVFSVAPEDAFKAGQLAGNRTYTITLTDEQA